MIATVVVFSIAACGGGGPTDTGHAVTVNDLQRKQYFFGGEHLGRIVTVTAVVSEVRGPELVDLSGGDFGDEMLPVVTEQPVALLRGQRVRVTGTVGQLHFSPPSEKAPYIQKDLYTKHETKAFLYGASVVPLSERRTALP